MERKTLKFRDCLVDLILTGKKNVTWRLFDDKNLQKGDLIDLINWNTKEKFGEATVVDIREKKLKEIEEGDFEGHEKFLNQEEMYSTYRNYYGKKVNGETIVKIITFKLN
jgi:hypothetical protein